MLVNLPLHLKASDQKGKQGTPIFDVVGTNNFIKEKLVEKGWINSIPIPSNYSFLGTDIDFGKSGALLEVQFSNYPFLLNNTLRSELLFKSKFKVGDIETKVVIIVTKAHMFPSSNSTLYYEQAKHQLNAMAKNALFAVPIRLVGLFEETNKRIPAIWTKYTSKRYSRKISKQKDIVIEINRRKRSKIFSIEVI
ncbi:MAG: restriction endonuclease [Candidatus Eremiobacteraeota bacterium]|nr:restriction endonuclease [Candidatus Eremiobacteraeota bacterium]